MERFKNTNIVITGETRGIGKAAALRFLREGANVIGISKSPFGFSSDEKISMGEYKHIEFDLRNTDSIDNLWQEISKIFSRIDVLVNNAGICHYSDFLDVDLQKIDETLNINLKSHLLLSQKVIKNMLHDKVAGKIIFISSVSGLFGGSKQVDYSATKAALIAATKSLTAAFGRNGIAVNVICPGTIYTDINMKNLDDENFKTERVKKIPLGRIGKPDDIAGPVLFLASDDASYITGTTLIVDGGWTCAIS